VRAELSEGVKEWVSFVSTARDVASAEELEALEKEVRDRLNRLGGLAVGLQIRQALDSQAAQEALRDAWLYGLRNKGKETVQISTATGFEVQIREIRTQRNYFVKNLERMARHDRLRARKLPIGSRCVESAIRRVVNLRIKGPCIFWCQANAEAILVLRCYWKAGRWNF
jgi:hypothetical protein